MTTPVATPFWYRYLVFLTMLGLIAQFAFAGLFLFADPEWLSVHADFGFLIGGLLLVLAVWAWIDPAARRHRRPATVLLAVYFVQVGLIVASHELGFTLGPAFHVANASLVLLGGACLFSSCAGDGVTPDIRSERGGSG